MAEYYTKPESDALFAPMEHDHNLEELGGTELPASRVAVPESVSASFGDAFTMDEALGSVASQLAGKANASHTHSGYATASHTHTGYATAEHEHTGYAETVHTHTEYAPASHTHTGYAEAEHTHTPASIGAAPSSHSHSEYAASNHGHTGYAASGHSHSAADVGALPASGGTVTGATTYNSDVTIKGKGYTQQILPFDGGSYSIGSADNRYYSTYLRVNPNVSSDRRCKRDIEAMDIDALAAFVNKLSVVNYNYNDDADDEAKRIGLIAQDVVAADPTIAQGCIEQDEKGFYSLRAADLVFPLIAAVQALTKRVEELEGK